MSHVPYNFLSENDAEEEVNDIVDLTKDMNCVANAPKICILDSTIIKKGIPVTPPLDLMTPASVQRQLIGNTSSISNNDLNSEILQLQNISSKYKRTINIDDNGDIFFVTNESKQHERSNIEEYLQIVPQTTQGDVGPVYVKSTYYPKSNEISEGLIQKLDSPPIVIDDDVDDVIQRNEEPDTFKVIHDNSLGVQEEVTIATTVDPNTLVTSSLKRNSKSVTTSVARPAVLLHQKLLSEINKLTSSLSKKPQKAVPTQTPKPIVTYTSKGEGKFNIKPDNISKPLVKGPMESNCRPLEKTILSVPEKSISTNKTNTDITKTVPQHKTVRANNVSSSSPSLAEIIETATAVAAITPNGNVQNKPKIEQVFYLLYPIGDPNENKVQEIVLPQGNKPIILQRNTKHSNGRPKESPKEHGITSLSGTIASPTKNKAVYKQHIPTSNSLKDKPIRLEEDKEEVITIPDDPVDESSSTFPATSKKKCSNDESASISSSRTSFSIPEDSTSSPQKPKKFTVSIKSINLTQEKPIVIPDDTIAPVRSFSLSKLKESIPVFEDPFKCTNDVLSRVSTETLEIGVSPSLVRPVDISQIINYGKKRDLPCRCGSTLPKGKIKTGGFRGFSSKERKKNLCLTNLKTAVKNEQKKITVLKKSVIRSLREPQVNFVCCDGPSGDFLPETLEFEANPSLVSQTINNRKRRWRGRSCRCGSVLLEYGTHCRRFKGFTSRQQKRTSCWKELSAAIKIEEKKISVLKSSVLASLREPQVNFVSWHGPDDDFSPEILKFEPDESHVKQEPQELEIVDLGRLEQLVHEHIYDTETLPTITEVVSQVTQQVRQLKEQRIKQRKNDDMFSKLAKPKEALKLIKQGLELIESWSRETVGTTNGIEDPPVPMKRRRRKKKRGRKPKEESIVKRLKTEEINRRMTRSASVKAKTTGDTKHVKKVEMETGCVKMKKVNNNTKGTRIKDNVTVRLKDIRTNKQRVIEISSDEEDLLIVKRVDIVKPDGNKKRGRKKKLPDA